MVSVVPGPSQGADGIAFDLNIPEFPLLLRRFLFQQLRSDDSSTDSDNNTDDPSDDDSLPSPTSNIRIFPSATATFLAPSDQSGLTGLKRECIRATSSWRKGPPRYDCVFVERNPDEVGFRGLHVARVKMFFSFRHKKRVFPCALINYYSVVGDEPCPDTRMWVVSPDTDDNGCPIPSIVHIDSIVRGAHLLGRSGPHWTPPQLTFADSLNSYKTFYVNKYADYHSHEIAF